MEHPENKISLQNKKRELARTRVLSRSSKKSENSVRKSLSSRLNRATRPREMSKSENRSRPRKVKRVCRMKGETKVGKTLKMKTLTKASKSQIWKISAKRFCGVGLLRGELRSWLCCRCTAFIRHNPIQCHPEFTRTTKIHYSDWAHFTVSTNEVLAALEWEREANVLKLHHIVQLEESREYFTAGWHFNTFLPLHCW